jgi:hypothetical protein
MHGSDRKSLARELLMHAYNSQIQADAKTALASLMRIIMHTYLHRVRTGPVPAPRTYVPDHALLLKVVTIT